MSWSNRLERVEVSKGAMDALVLDWLVNQGHSDAARTFARESGTHSAAVDGDGIAERMAIRQSIEGGRIQDGIDAIIRLDPTVRFLHAASSAQMYVPYRTRAPLRRRSSRRTLVSSFSCAGCS